jgi:hypothetical protein
MAYTGIKITDEQMQILRLLVGPTHPTDALDAAAIKGLWLKLEQQIAESERLRDENAALRTALRGAKGVLALAASGINDALETGGPT